jgi:DNA-binding transcriptional ArsR family regulator
MAQYSSQLDDVFQALADPTRRAVLGRLGTGPASIGELAAPFEMALPSFMKHIRYLEKTGWITTRKTGRLRTCTLEKKSFDVIDTWLGEQRRIWTDRTDRLEHFVTTPHERNHSNDELP